jgi:hypothetical protein
MLSSGIRRVLSTSTRTSSSCITSPLAAVTIVAYRPLSTPATSSTAATAAAGASPLRGVLAPVLTPVEKDSFKPDMARLVDRSNWLLDNGCHGLVLFGTTGEATSFSPSQRMSMFHDPSLTTSVTPVNHYVVEDGVGV